jgi:hypothetical protein
MQSRDANQMSLALNEPNKIGRALCSNSETTPPPSMHHHKWKERKKERNY